MKKLFLFASAALLSMSLFAQTPAPAQTSAPVKKAEDVVKFKELSFDFGKIKQGIPATHDFAFTNIGNSPVIIESALASCGCTTPHKPEGAVTAGKSDIISAQYNAANAGPFNKSITVKLAGIDLPVVLKITGEVLAPDAYAKYEASKPTTPSR
jgi:Protein of unknown function (DUF1573)